MLTKILTLPPGFTLFSGTNLSQKTLRFYQISVFLITFSAYSSFHASRKPQSIVKSVLQADHNGGWAPFGGELGPHRLGELDLAFLSAYAIGMFFSGHVGDRINLRSFLVFGMVGSGISNVVFGLGFWFRVHKLGFFLVVQIVSGLFQSTGWPCVISVVGNWFGKSKRGLIMGIWNSNTSIGNIFGSVVASSALEYGWGWSFLLPGILIICVGVLVFLFLVVNPEDVGFEIPGKEIEMNSHDFLEDTENVEDEEEGLIRPGGTALASDSIVANGFIVKKEEDGLIQPGGTASDSTVAIGFIVQGEEEGLIQTGGSASDSTLAIGFIEAWRLPGVAPYACCLFFSKFVAYTFLYWLPFYIRQTAVAGVHLSHRSSGILSTIFDIGGVFGGISAGYISDMIDARAVTSILFLLFSIPALTLYRIYGSVSMLANVGLMFLSGFLVNGPYSLITTAVSADLGTQSLVKENSRALATVTAIIDGTGSVGAALGPVLTGYISTRGWNSVFLMLISSIFLAGLFLIHLAKAEIRSKISEKTWPWDSIFAR